MPRVSVGLPVYNGGQFLQEAIESVLAQTFEDLELIVADNASTDDTEAICREFAARDPRVRYYRHDTNLGAVRNFAVVVEHARAPYFKWIAADDVVEPTFVERCVELLDADPELVLATSRYRVVDELGGTLFTLDYDYDFRSPEAHRRWRSLFGETMGHEHPIWGVIRASVLRRTQLMRAFVGSDSALVAELLLEGPFGQVPDYLHRMRIHAGAYSSGLRTENGRDGMQGPAEAKWLDPASRDGNLMPTWRLLREFLLLARTARESRRDRLLAAATLVPLAMRWRVILVKEPAFRVGLGRPYIAVRNLYRRFVPRGDAGPSRPLET
jgi:glycosyltransferase involved in cell wall biosynthesis